MMINNNGNYEHGPLQSDQSMMVQSWGRLFSDVGSFRWWSARARAAEAESHLVGGELHAKLVSGIQKFFKIFPAEVKYRAKHFESNGVYFDSPRYQASSRKKKKKKKKHPQEDQSSSWTFSRWGAEVRPVSDALLDMISHCGPMILGFVPGPQVKKEKKRVTPYTNTKNIFLF